MTSLRNRPNKFDLSIIMPQLTHLTIRGFRSIRALEEFELRPLNVLIGANGAGKTNFIALFHMLSRMAEQNLWRFVLEQGGPDAVLFGGRKQTKQVDAAFILGDHVYRFTLTPSGEKIAFGAEATGLLYDNGINTHTLGHGHHESILWDEDASASDRFAPYVREAISGWRTHHFHDTSLTSGVRNAQDLCDNLKLHSDASNLGPVLWRLREQYPHSYRRIIETVQLVAPFFGDFTYPEKEPKRLELKWFHAGDPEKELGLYQLSDGTLRFICLATLILQPNGMAPSLMLIDEPELGLHPYAITLLAGLLKSVSDTRQIIVSTQSSDLVNELEPEDVVVVNRDSGGSTFERLRSDRLSIWLEDGHALGDLWKMNTFDGRP